MQTIALTSWFKFFATTRKKTRECGIVPAQGKLHFHFYRFEL